MMIGNRGIGHELRTSVKKPGFSWGDYFGAYFRFEGKSKG
jgi:hypothetical protein